MTANDKWLTPEQRSEIREEDYRLRNQLGDAYDCHDSVIRLLDHIEADDEKVRVFVKEMMQYKNDNFFTNMHLWRILKRLSDALITKNDPFQFPFIKTIDERDAVVDFIRDNPRPYWEEDET